MILKERSVMTIGRMLILLFAVVWAPVGMARIAPAGQTSAQPAVAGQEEGAKVLIDNSHVTVSDVEWVKGRAWPIRRYEEDTIVVPITPASLVLTDSDGKSRTASLRQGEIAFWPKGTNHSVLPVTNGRTIVTRFKDNPATRYQNTSGAGAAFPRPGVKKLMENERIVVWDYEWLPGKPTPTHFHDKDVVIVYLADGAVRSVTPSKEATENAFKFAEVRFNIGNRTHHEEYIRGDHPRAIITELK